jgi:hypothetical protein
VGLLSTAARPSAIRRVAAAALLTLLWAVAPGGAVGARAAAAGPSLYGQVVAVGPQAFVLALGNGSWVAVNLVATTVVTAQAPGVGAIADGDWALVTYTVQRQSLHGLQAMWLVARSVTYAPTPFVAGVQNAHIAGTVTALYAGGGFAVATASGTWLVAVTPGTLVRLGGTPASLAFLQVGDAVQVWGTAIGHQIVAARVVYHLKGGGGSGGERGRGGGGSGGDRGQSGGGDN